MKYTFNFSMKKQTTYKQNGSLFVKNNNKQTNKQTKHNTQ